MGDDRSTESPHNAVAESGARRKGAAVVRIDARQLLGDACEVIIVHRHQEYRLRCTRSGKLILTK